mmetsp:Transcript_13664/g.39061  ORF Transcript_13664/g.39061 Transcript_13664/m.39061 type:complete len:224 (+) Transcript_13664:395-1066(+)
MGPVQPRNANAVVACHGGRPDPGRVLHGMDQPVHELRFGPGNADDREELRVGWLDLQLGRFWPWVEDVGGRIRRHAGNGLVRGRLRMARSLLRDVADPHQRARLRGLCHLGRVLELLVAVHFLVQPVGLHRRSVAVGWIQDVQPDRILVRGAESPRLHPALALPSEQIPSRHQLRHGRIEDHGYGDEPKWWRAPAKRRSSSRDFHHRRRLMICICKINMNIHA